MSYKRLFPSETKDSKNIFKYYNGIFPCFFGGFVCVLF